MGVSIIANVPTYFMLFSTFCHVLPHTYVCVVCDLALVRLIPETTYSRGVCPEVLLNGWIV